MPFLWCGAVGRINKAIERLDWNNVQVSLQPEDDSEAKPVEVCSASLRDWDRFVESEDQALISRMMEWHDGKIYIVELPCGVHEGTIRRVGGEVMLATGTRWNYLIPHGSTTFISHFPSRKPDSSYGPRSLIGATLPTDIRSWREYHTLKVEVGVSQGWKNTLLKSGLNATARFWRGVPGVEYVLSIRLNNQLTTCQYRLDSIVRGGFEAPRMRITNIDVGSVLYFDARRLLGLEPEANLPAGFNDPVELDLFQVVQMVRQQAVEDEA